MVQHSQHQFDLHVSTPHVNTSFSNYKETDLIFIVKELRYHEIPYPKQTSSKRKKRELSVIYTKFVDQLKWTE